MNESFYMSNSDLAEELRTSMRRLRASVTELWGLLTEIKEKQDDLANVVALHKDAFEHLATIKEKQVGLLKIVDIHEDKIEHLTSLLKDTQSTSNKYRSG